MPEMTTAATVERVTKFRTGDLNDLCDAADLAIRDGGGFGWVDPPPRDVMERYWKGVLIVPERHLFVPSWTASSPVRPACRPAAQQRGAGPFRPAHHVLRRPLGARPRPCPQAGPGGRDGGAGNRLPGLNLDVRETQRAAIALYKAMGQHWGTHPFYAIVRGQALPAISSSRTSRPPIHPPPFSLLPKLSHDFVSRDRS